MERLNYVRGEALKAVQNAAEMTTFKLLILGEDQMDRVWVHKVSTGQTVVYSGHDHTNTLHREEVGFCADPTHGQVTHRLEFSIIRNHHRQIPHQDRKSHLHPVLYAPTNEADDEAKAAFSETL